MKLTNKNYQNKIIKEYLSYLSKVKGYSQHTVKSYNSDINQYLKIIPCGLDNKKVTSISELISVKPKKFENNLANIFIKNINNI